MNTKEQKIFNRIGNEGHFFKNTDDNTIYYHNEGQGSTSMLFLHTLRTQAEFHHKILSSFTDDYNCYVLDWPGHGRSSMDPKVKYDANYMINQVIEFIESKDLKNLILVGESIGATGVLALAARIPNSIKSVYAYNPYDEGMIMGTRIGRIVAKLAQRSPFVGKTEIRAITKHIIGGGFYDKNRLDTSFLNLISKNGKTAKNFGIAFNSVLANQKSWYKIRDNDYPKIPKTIPVVLNYGEQDWSAKWVRKENAKNIGGNLTMVSKDKMGHFSFLEAPHHIIELITKGEQLNK